MKLIFAQVHLLGWVVLRIYVAVTIFHSYWDLEAGGTQSLKSSGETGNGTPDPSSANQELNHSKTDIPSS